MKQQKLRNHNRLTQTANMTKTWAGTPHNWSKIPGMHSCACHTVLSDNYDSIKVSTGLSVQVKDLISYNSHSSQMQISRTTNACKRKSRTDRFCCLAHLRCSSCPEADSLTHARTRTHMNTHTHTHTPHSLACSHMLWGVLAAWPLWSGPLPSLSPELWGLCLPNGARALSLNLVSKYTAASRNSSLSSWAGSHGKCRRNYKNQEEGGVDVLFCFLRF